MVAILVPYLIGLVYTPALGAPLFTLPPLALTNPSHINATVPSAFFPPSSSNNLPPSPYYYTDRSSPTSKPITVKFYHYGQTLPKHPVLTVFNTVLRDVNAQLHPQDLVPDREMHYSSENVHLLMYQAGEMTWEVLESTIGALFHFVNTYECVWFDFDVGGFDNEKTFAMGVLALSTNEILATE